MSNIETNEAAEGVAIIGMAGRFPGAQNIEQFWHNLRDGVESISVFTEEELLASGVSTSLMNQPNYVRAGGVLDDVELFDGAFFGYSPRESEVLDPQHRFFLECAWEAFENAGYNPEVFPGPVGVFAGMTMSSYLERLLANKKLIETVGGFQTRVSNDKDQLATRVSYKLNLKGPSLAVQTACSTSLVAVGLAVQNLLNYQCDMALAGGVSIAVPQKVGYLWQGGGIASPDGHCRAFDAEGQGAVGGSGVGVVLLKRLDEAIADGDFIYATIRGVAINNDGSLKVGFTAPSIGGQAEVIAMAQAMAGVEPETITYVEAHGTGTPIGDPIEISALMKAFRTGTKRTGFCALGSVKTNIGHLDAAAGVAGLIKTSMAMQHRQIPPSLHYTKPNPKIDFENSPFYVNTKLSEWRAGSLPLRAGVSSFGIGGTNAHVVLEEAPTPEESGPSRPYQLLVLSAKTESALEAATANLVAYLDSNPGQNLADIAYTLHCGRKAFPFRQALVCSGVEDARQTLRARHPQRLLSGVAGADEPPVAFMFPGLGDHYVNMARGLYETEQSFRRHVDQGCEMLKPLLGVDIREIIYPAPSADEKATEGNDTAVPRLDLRAMLRRAPAPEDELSRRLNRTAVAQPAVFVINYAMAQLLMEWGIKPAAMIGYSIGEYVAACVAGVLSFADALTLVARRAQLIEPLPGGALLGLSLSEDEVAPLLGDDLYLAAVNGASLTVVAGTVEAVAALEATLEERGVPSRRLSTTHPFHTKMMEPVADALTSLVESIELRPPKIPYLSNVTGEWITDAQATDPRYWARHMCGAVRFSEGLGELCREQKYVLLEVGPGHTLTSFALQMTQTDGLSLQAALPTIRNSYDRQPDAGFLLNAVGRTWLAGASVNWPKFYATEKRRRLPLPTYPFERKRFWIDAVEPEAQDAPGPKMWDKKPDLTDWFYAPSWSRCAAAVRPVEASEAEKRTWLVFGAGDELTPNVVHRLRAEGMRVVVVERGEQFERVDERWTIDPRRPEHYEALVKELKERDEVPSYIAHLWGVAPEAATADETEAFRRAQEVGFYSLLRLVQALNKLEVVSPVQVNVVTSDMHEVVGDESLRPEKATLLGACKVIPQEYPHINCRSIDLSLSGPQSPASLTDKLVAEMSADAANDVIAYRGTHRWRQTFEALRLGASANGTGLRREGVYLIVGGLGKVGFILAQKLTTELRAKVVLTGREGLPPKESWAHWLAAKGEEDATGRRIRKLEALEQSGAEVVVMRADASNEEEMRRAVAATVERFGALHGVVHAAGLVDSKNLCPVQNLDAEICEAQFRAKAHGAYVLKNVLRGVPLDFCVLFSSSSAVLGGLGLCAYASANTFLDAFAHRQNRAGGLRWISVDWDTWSERTEPESADAPRTTLAKLVMTPDEAFEAFSRALRPSGVSQVVVSLGDLHARIAQWVERSGEVLTEAGVAASPAHSRPTLANQYLPPRNEMEQTLVDIWQEVLGINTIGVYDNFFELGGHSLLGVRVISRVRRHFKVSLPVSVLFEAPTIAELAEAILIKRTQHLDEAALASLLGSLEQPPGEAQPSSSDNV
ncbi:MAG TPA: SDR family oxidoreductase [Pyrinomonadaceae bacterium]|nr:SDR family oxidoreductase [Pyrinomonadaceae bacterium]